MPRGNRGNLVRICTRRAENPLRSSLVVRGPDLSRPIVSDKLPPLQSPTGRRLRPPMG